MDKVEQNKSFLIDLLESFYLCAEQKAALSIRTLTISLAPSLGELTIMNEDGTISVSKQYSEWMISDETQEKDSRTNIIRSLQTALRTLKEEGYFNHPLFQLPLSILLEDIDSKKPKELLLVEDIWSDYQTSLMKGLDKDLSIFFDQLMSDSNLD